MEENKYNIEQIMRKGHTADSVEFGCYFFDEKGDLNEDQSTSGYYIKVPFFSTYRLWEKANNNLIAYKNKTDEFYYVKQNLKDIYTIINKALENITEKIETIEKIGKYLKNTEGIDFSRNNVFLTNLSNAFHIAPMFDKFVRNMKLQKSEEDVSGLPKEIRNKINGYLTRGRVKDVYLTEFIVQ